MAPVVRLWLPEDDNHQVLEAPGQVVADTVVDATATLAVALERDVHLVAPSDH